MAQRIASHTLPPIATRPNASVATTQPGAAAYRSTPSHSLAPTSVATSHRHHHGRLNATVLTVVKRCNRARRRWISSTGAV